MKLVIQRVRTASVMIGEELISEIGQGLLVLLGVHVDDTPQKVDWYVNKLINMRIFCDNDGKMNLSVQDIAGEILIVSQFTLYGQAEKGHRPSFIEAARPEVAIPIYKKFIEKCEGLLGGDKIKTGVFGADMQVGLVNDGPVTIIL